ncbi:cystathionine gamma-synthase [Sporolactobacillus inulinus]|uniref:Cystathionine gamma-synthase n=1 Tax=Sporolactobacillus inulinus TaxID=2078 RepID=A0A4Y1ZGS9_9BACL|nr:cystathionine gamma-synthase [Sporolactobacillus inulinus]
MGTKTVWAGEKEVLVHHATQVPVIVSVAYNYDDMDEWYDVAIGNKPGHIYGRNTNPTVQAFEDKVKALEGAEDATSFTTGMAAISNTLYTFLKPGDRVVSIKDTYGGTNKISQNFFLKLVWTLRCARRAIMNRSRPKWRKDARSSTLRRRRIQL